MNPISNITELSKLSLDQPSQESKSNKSEKDQPIQESKASRASEKKVKKQSLGYSNFSGGKSIEGFSDVELTELIIDRISEKAFNIINVERCTHTFPDANKSLYARKISLVREFDWSLSNISKIRLLPVYVKEQVFGEPSDKGREHLQLASYLYKRVILWISEDCKSVDISMNNYNSW